MKDYAKDVEDRFFNYVGKKTNLISNTTCASLCPIFRAWCPSYVNRRIAILAQWSLLPTCWLCKRPISGFVYFQGGQKSQPSHNKCLVVIAPSKRHGGGI